jgi:hypothetical protein
MAVGELQRISVAEGPGTVRHRGQKPRTRNPDLSLVEYLSTAAHVKRGWNPRGPPRKAKYYLATDSGLVP